VSDNKKLLLIGGVVVTAGALLGGVLSACDTPKAAEAAPAPTAGENIDTFETMQEDMGLIIGG